MATFGGYVLAILAGLAFLTLLSYICERHSPVVGLGGLLLLLAMLSWLF